MEYQQLYQPEETRLPDAPKPKKHGGILSIVLIVLAAAAGFFLVFFWQKTTVYPTLEDYRQAGGKLPYEIPENAADCHFAIRKSMLSKAYFYSFVLDEKALASYTVALDQDHHIIGNETGYGKWFGRKAEDCTDPDYTLNDFPLHLPFETVIDEPIGGDTVILYSPTGTGSRSSGVLANEESGRVVVFQKQNAK